MGGVGGLRPPAKARRERAHASALSTHATRRVTCVASFTPSARLAVRKLTRNVVGRLIFKNFHKFCFHFFTALAVKALKILYPQR